MTINHIGLSGGKDSTALYGWAINESGYPLESIRGSFADTENEYQEVYDQIKALDEYGQKRGVAPITTLKSEGFLQLCIRKKRFPSAKARFCTEELKIKPMIRHLASLHAQGFEIVLHSGVRRDESTERSLLEEWGEKTYKDGKDFIVCKQRRPLLDWSLEAVWAAHKRFGLPINPLYFQGRKRVGCKLCCMSGKEDVRATVLHHPETIDMYREWETTVSESCGISNNYRPFFTRDVVPMSQRSKEVTDKHGKKWMIPTIDDVARWAFTMRGGVQGGFDFMFEEDDSHLPCQSGYCE